MNYRHVMRIHLQKDNAKQGSALIKSLSYRDAQAFINTITDPSFLIEVKNELQKESRSTTIRTVIEAIDQRLDKLLAHTLSQNPLN